MNIIVESGLHVRSNLRQLFEMDILFLKVENKDNGQGEFEKFEFKFVINIIEINSLCLILYIIVFFLM